MAFSQYLQYMQVKAYLKQYLNNPKKIWSYFQWFIYYFLTIV